MKQTFLATLAILLFQAAALAETVNCKAFLMKASAQMENEKKSMTAKQLVLSGKADDILEASMTYKKMELFASAYKDERSDLYELSYVVKDLQTGKRELMDQVLLLGTGPSKQNGWEGPKGTLNYEFVRSSLQPLPMIGYYTHSAFSKLSALGLKTRSLSNVYQDVETIQKAVVDGVLKEGEVIGAGFMLNCFSQP